MENDDPQDVIYTLAAPYMVDANGEVCRDVRFEVEPGKNIHESVVKVIADQTWLNASDRAYPVVIDRWQRPAVRNRAFSIPMWRPADLMFVILPWEPYILVRVQRMVSAML